MNVLADRLERLEASATLAMSQKSQELREQGVDVVNLSVGEPDFNTPEATKTAAKLAIDENYSHYSPVAGYKMLREAVADKLKRENGLKYSPSQVLCSNGAKQCICNVLLALVNEGDEVLIPAPYWVSYPQMAKLAGGTPVFVRSDIERGFKVSPEDLEASITERTRVFILCSPSNPTGAVYSRKEIESLAEVLVKHPNIIIISDEIYEHINYTGEYASLAQVGALKDRVVVVNGVSKAYAMTGWRIGFLAAAEWIVKGCNKLQGQYTSGPCSVSQMAAVAALSGDQTPVEQMRQAFLRRRDLIVDLASQLPGFEVAKPDGAFYVFPRVSGLFGKRCGERVIENSSGFAMFLLEEAHVASVGGDAFGAPGYVRFSYATSEDNIRRAMLSIAGALKRLS